VFLAVLDSGADGDGRALGAHELLRFVLLALLLCAETVLHAAKVGGLALEALIVGEFEHCVFLQIVVPFFLQLWVLIDAFELRSL